MSEGKKYDTGKPRWSLLPIESVMEVIKVLEFGARKYEPNNWQKVPDARTRYYDAMQRHIHAWRGGERNDPETGLHHLAHAGCCVLFCMWLDWNEVTPPEEDWIEWYGGACPVQAESKVEYVTEGVAGQINAARADTLRWWWAHTGTFDDIVRYRIVK